MESPPPDQNVALTVGEMLEAKGKEWDLDLVTGEQGLDRRITTFELNRPGLALAGYYDVFSVDRIQLIGLTETEFLRSLNPEELQRRLKRTLEFTIPCVIVTTSLEIAPEFVEIMRQMGIPLLRTSHITSPFQAELSQYLERWLAPRWSAHGVMVEVFGLGVMIEGRSGVGKSECGLDLVDRGHLLVADDIVMVRRAMPQRLFAGHSPTLRYHMEIRGIGIIDVERLFGVRSVKEESELQLLVELERWDPDKEYERLGLAEGHKMLFDCRVPHMVLPVEPGRNIAQLIEIAALMQRMRNEGVDVARDFDERIQKIIEARRSRRS